MTAELSLIERAKAARIETPDLEAWLAASERAKVIPAEDFLVAAQERLRGGKRPDPGLELPWAKLRGLVSIPQGKLVLWTGFTHHGKSTAVKQTILSAISQGQKCAVGFFEERCEECWESLLMMAVATEDPSVDAIKRFGAFTSGKLWFYDQQGSVEPRKLKGLIYYCSKELGVTQIVLDSLMMVALRRDDYDGQADFVRDLKRIAEATRCTVHLIAHMRKREGHTGDEKPGSIHDIAGPHDLASVADHVFNVWRDKLRKDPKASEAVLRVDKQRGPKNWIGAIGLGYHQSSRQLVEGYEAMRFWEREPGEEA